MKASVKSLTGVLFILLAACSTQEVKQGADVGMPATTETPAVPEDAPDMSGQNPPLTINKGDETLKLVRIMDGGVCKNDFQGAKGVFLVYADADDIERIKREKGPEVFAEFENKIQAFSIDALQEAVEATNLAEDPFSLGEDEAQQKLAKQLSKNFRNAVAAAIDAFQNETTLTVDVVPFPPSLIFYQNGCEAAHLEPETEGQ
ncbi:MAG: hypothetical protein M8364_19345 [Methylobacter sp.]|jgi:hypothetical protein|uniref:hypothetical protein n=1 Tax=Methylobacter TaxID=429 RepID=UPI0003673054|nr:MULTISPECIES: hypothetical protein [Methylobacter]MCL7423052.1 hypothetical protein [Methylobacter sp.]